MKASNHKPFGFLQSLEPPSKKYTHASMGFIKPLPRSKIENLGLIDMVDRLSKMIYEVLFPKIPLHQKQLSCFLITFIGIMDYLQSSYMIKIPCLVADFGLFSPVSLRKSYLIIRELTSNRRTEIDNKFKVRRNDRSFHRLS